ncbi:MAG: DEAD/DEAH box helicase, partial [Gammaproteobacteria bacterium]|nr:DEAD/DEAH box helicase [Gammaproteobacteria bacterium]
MLRRTKQEVVKELPPKSEILRNVELAGAQRDLYESIRLAMHTKVRDEINKKGMARSQIIILDALLKLRQVCCDPRLVKLDSAKKVKHSAKLELLMEMLPEMVEEGRRILLFSQFTGMLALIEEELKQRKLDYVQLTGNTRDRATPVQRFQAGEVPLFLISLKAGGTGLNLTAADTVIHYDPWWNPAVENQATDRAHRIGQDKAVFVYKLITSGTVEEKILGLQARKKELANSLFDETAKSGPKLTLEDLNALFEPLG